jgi:coenzyme PQQ precursor peptide PqqA
VAAFRFQAKEQNRETNVADLLGARDPRTGHGNAICAGQTGDIPHTIEANGRDGNNAKGDFMKIWNKPQVREQAVGMEVTAYLPADIDLI